MQNINNTFLHIMRYYDAFNYKSNLMTTIIALQPTLTHCFDSWCDL